MRFGFVTCVQLGLSCLEALIRLGGRPDLLISLEDDQAPDKTGRIYLDEVCRQYGGRLLKTRSINDPKVVEAIEEASIDWLFIIGWSQIAGSQVLEAPSQGVLGIHPTLLPQGRGRAPIPWAIIKGLTETGVTLFKLDEGVDTGPVLHQLRLPIGARETATSLYARVNAAHVELMELAWPLLNSGEIALAPQDEAKATTWPQRKPEDGCLTGEMTVTDVDRLVRALAPPYPGAFLRLPHCVLRILDGAPAEELAPISHPLRLVVADGEYAIKDAEALPIAK